MRPSPVKTALEAVVAVAGVAAVMVAAADVGVAAVATAAAVGVAAVVAVATAEAAAVAAADATNLLAQISHPKKDHGQKPWFFYSREAPRNARDRAPLCRIYLRTSDNLARKCGIITDK